MSRTRLAPCRCGHPGAGCSCYDERVAEAGWRDKGKVRFPTPVNLGPRRRPKVSTRSEVRRDLGMEADEVEHNTCQKCGATIRVMVFRGTGYCSGHCRD